jgi:hypothetical protein
MDIKTFSVSYSRTYNLGNYQSLKLGGELTLSFDPFIHVTSQFDDARREIQQLVEDQADRIIKQIHDTER